MPRGIIRKELGSAFVFQIIILSDTHKEGACLPFHSFFSHDESINLGSTTPQPTSVMGVYPKLALVSSHMIQIKP